MNKKAHKLGYSNKIYKMIPQSIRDDYKEYKAMYEKASRTKHMNQRKMSLAEYMNYKISNTEMSNKQILKLQTRAPLTAKQKQLIRKAWEEQHGRKFAKGRHSQKEYWRYAHRMWKNSGFDVDIGSDEEQKARKKAFYNAMFQS